MSLCDENVGVDRCEIHAVIVREKSGVVPEEVDEARWRLLSRCGVFGGFRVELWVSLLFVLIFFPCPWFPLDGRTWRGGEGRGGGRE
jgi:hypothetical protein